MTKLCSCCIHTEHKDVVFIVEHSPYEQPRCRRCRQECDNANCHILLPNKNGTYGRVTRHQGSRFKRLFS